MKGYYAICVALNLGFASIDVALHAYGFAVFSFGAFLFMLVLFNREPRD